MPSTPKRLEISIVYTSSVGLEYGDTFRLDYSGLLLSFSINHLTYRTSTYDMIGVNFMPEFTLAAASLTTPFSESIVQFELDPRFYDPCLSVNSLYSGDGMRF